VALARALVARPKLLLLDEPLSNLDAALRESMRSELRALQRSVGITTLFVTHDQTEALSMSDRVAVMREGLIVQEAAPREIYSRPADSYVANFLGRINSFKAVVEGTDSDGNVLLQTGPARLSVRSDATVRSGSAITLAVRPENMRLRTAGATSRNSLDGVLVESSFLGDAVDYRVMVHDETPVIVKQASSATFAIGSRVRVEFDPADGLIYAERGH
jgi:iron(III) transport system ATP-binding protein